MVGTSTRIALVLLMVALTAGAGLAIFVLVAEPTGDLPPRLLGTAAFLALCSLTGLCGALLIERGRVLPVGVMDIVASIATFGIGMVYVWGLVEPTIPADIRPLGAAVVASTALGWISLLMLLLGRATAVTIAVVVTVAAVTGLAGLLLALIVSDQLRGATVARVTAVAAILAVLGSFLAPLLDRVLGGSGSAGSSWIDPPGPPLTADRRD